MSLIDPPGKPAESAPNDLFSGTLISCVVCLYTGEGEASEAVTIIAGNAACEEHMGYFQDDALSRVIYLLSQQAENERRKGHRA